MRPEPAGPAGGPVIIGAGLAGLVAALELAPRPVTILTKATLDGGAASFWSQGGLAAAMLEGDSPALHAADTIASGDGLCDPDSVRHYTEGAPAAVAALEGWDMRFARTADGAYACKLEAAHSHRRVLNAGGDGTGAAIMRALLAKVRETPSITILDATEALELVVGDGGIEGIVVARNGEISVLPTRAAVIATGGSGGLWRDTTNPPGAIGQGVGLAARAGARLIDLEFMQFHPTALDVGRDPMPLASEALRGDGAVLIDDRGEPVMADYPRRDLEPRDIVSRAVWRRIAAGRRVYLDTRAAIGADLPRRFPGVAASCQAAGIDPVAEPIPIRPAAHYHMGGIQVDRRGRNGIDGLWACGEAASTGLHGANRLASNSLLEAVVSGQDVAADLAGIELPAGATPTAPAVAPPARDPAALQRVRAIMTEHVGVLRDAEGLRRAVSLLLREADAPGPAQQALMVTVAALARTESRGGHARTDFPQHDPAQAVRRAWTWDEALAFARELT
ncbi:MAG TPA: L-aspartate oxidase [Stellaceae bacterium]|nr:L-aspartate oxidase [Stellaceae bacterium]